MRDRTAWILLTVLAILAFIVKMVFMSGAMLYPGTDAGYYVSRTMELVQTGAIEEMWISSPPFVFVIAAIFFFATSDIFLAVKLTGAVLASLSGIVLFFLSRELFRDWEHRDKVALIAAAVAMFCAANLRMMADLLKNMGASVVYPLFFLFYLRGTRAKKWCNYNNLIALALLGICYYTHKSAIGMAGLVLITYIAFLAAFERKLPTVEIRTAAVILAVGFVASLPLGGLSLIESITTSTGWLGYEGAASTTMGRGLELVHHHGWLIFPAFLGLAFCVLRGGKGAAFTMNWFVTGLILASPFVSSTGSWRFSLMLFLPIAILCGIFLAEVFERKGAPFFWGGLAILALITVGGLVVMMNDPQVQAGVPDEDVPVLRRMGQSVETPCHLYAQDRRTAYWVEVFTGCELFIDKPESVDDGGVTSYLLFNAKQGVDNPFIQRHGELAFEEDDYVLVKLASIPQEGIADEYFPELEDDEESYSAERLESLQVWLFFPVELLNMLNLPYSSIFRFVVGFPASAACWAFLLGLVLAISGDQKERKWLVPTLLIVALAFSIVIYTGGRDPFKQKGDGMMGVGPDGQNGLPPGEGGGRPGPGGKQLPSSGTKDILDDGNRSQSQSQQQDVGELSCGDGRCDRLENCAECEQDCPCDLPNRQVCDPEDISADNRGCTGQD